MRRKIAALTAFLVVCGVPLGLFTAAIWTSRTLSYSGKLGLTGFEALLALPVIVFFAALILDHA